MSRPSLILNICILSLSIFTALLGSATAQESLQPKHVTKLQAVLSAAISPNGTQTAYTLMKPREPMVGEDGPAYSELHVVDTEGNSRPFITGKVSIGTPHWSADGQSIFYTSKRGDDDHTSLYRIPINGGESTQALSHSTSMGGFSLHPDGTQIAFLATDEEDKDVKKIEEQGFNQEIFEEEWKFSKVWIASLEQDADEPRSLELPGSASMIKWNHAGDKLLVILAPTPSVDDSYMSKQIYMVDAATGDVLGKIDHASKLGDVSWSPDDSHLAMIAGVDIHDPMQGRLMVAEAKEGAQPKDLMPDLEAHVASFAWQNDHQLIWTADENTLTKIGTVSLDGMTKTLTEPSADIGILTDLTLSADGSLASLTGHSRQHYFEVFQLDTANGKANRLTNSNRWLDDISLAKQETITWKAKDGLELQGVLVYPLGYEAGKRYPMIMLVHGGPESHVSDGWVTSYSRPGQMAAARGFFTFYPNYRSSTGRSVEFSKMGQADAGNKEFSDLIDGIDHLVSLGMVDKDKVGITGGSYGGYASAWGATYYSDRFAASVMFVGISDNMSKVGTTDIPDEMYLVHHRKRLWEDWDYFLNSSPIRYVERNRTPTLILHGKEDPRVHPSQSLELHRHLKTLDQAPVRLVLYEGEGHGNRKAAARLDYNLRLLRWMEHFLSNDNSEAPEKAIDYAEALGISKEDQGN